MYSLCTIFFATAAASFTSLPFFSTLESRRGGGKKIIYINEIFLPIMKITEGKNKNNFRGNISHELNRLAIGFEFINTNDNESGQFVMHE